MLCFVANAVHVVKTFIALASIISAVVVVVVVVVVMAVVGALLTFLLQFYIVMSLWMLFPSTLKEHSLIFLLL